MYQHNAIMYDLLDIIDINYIVEVMASFSELDVAVWSRLKNTNRTL